MHAICHKAGLLHANYTTSTQLFLPRCMPSAIWQLAGRWHAIHTPNKHRTISSPNVTYSNSQLTVPTVFKLNVI